MSAAPDLNAKARAFRELHRRDRVFLMPNAWDQGSARLLASAGFDAIATTSAGIAYSLGVPDYRNRVSRERMMERVAEIAAAVDIPVSGDLEAGYGDTPDEVARTIALSVEAGLAGCNIEDHSGDADAPLYEPALAAERIRAAREAADASGIDYTLTGRSDCYLVGHPDPFAESVRRANLYCEAGADCLFVPGVKSAEDIARLVREVHGPINVVMGLAGAALSVAELGRLGVRRISIGGSLQRATFGLVRRAAEEMRAAGTFGYASQQIPDAELSDFFERWDDRR